jgi:hypothetical protein
MMEDNDCIDYLTMEDPSLVSGNLPGSDSNPSQSFLGMEYPRININHNTTSINNRTAQTHIV